MKEGVIPSYYADFYGALPFSKTVKDDVSPFVTEDVEDEDDFIITNLDID